jgi:hypothetical protein
MAMTDLYLHLPTSDGRLFEVPVPPVNHGPYRPTIRIRGRVLRPSAVFDTYWRFAVARQAIYMARMRKSPLPWTHDDVLRVHRFTNVFRASDRVSQFLIRAVQRGPGASDDPTDAVFRTLLFKVFNREDTWLHLESRVGPVTWGSYDFARYLSALDEAALQGPIYSAAYMMPPPRLGEARKHANHLRLLERIMRDNFAREVTSASSLRSIYEALVSYPGLGRFLAFQYTIDLNYSDFVSFDENDFVVAGPGAKDGIRKCFGREAVGIEEDVIRYMTDTQDEQFSRLELNFPGLFGRRLHLIDAQNLFCEVDKYARVRHPEVAGISGRSKIKQRYSPGGALPKPMFPRRWGLDSDRGVLDGCGVEVHGNAAPLVVSEFAPHGVASQDRPLPLGTW